MKKLKITLLVFYILIVIVLLYEAIIPGSVSASQHGFMKKVINNISKIFIRKKTIKPNELVINNSFKESYYTNETLTLDVSVLPNNASYKTLSFTSSNTNILEVDSSGLITFKEEGKANVIVRQEESNLEKIIEFNVLKYVEPIEELIKPDSITLKSYDDINTIPIGDYIRFYVEYNKDDVTDRLCKLESSDESICKVYDDCCFGIGVGNVTLTLRHLSTNLTSTMNITITDGTIIQPTYFKLNGDSDIYINDEATHTYSVDIDPNASNMFKVIKYYAVDPSTNLKSNIVDISRSGKLIIKGYGEAYIYAQGYNYKISMPITIHNILPEFSLDDKRIILKDSYKVEIKPTNSSSITYDKYAFISSDENIATIDGLGNIQTKKEGKTTITVIVDDGIDRIERSFILLVEKKVIEDDIGSNFGKIIRKGIAHFLGFITFGFVAFFMFLLFIKDNYEGNIKKSLIVILVNGLVFAILTELIQLVSPGRDGTIRDVILDYIGYLIAFIISLIAYLIYTLIRKKKGIKDTKTTTLEEE